MRRVSVLLLVAVALAAGLAACGGGGKSKVAKPSAVVERATLRTARKLRFTVFRDPATGDLQFRFRRAPSTEFLIGADFLPSPDVVDRFPSIDAAWNYLETDFGISRKSVEQALKHSTRVPRPATMVSRVPAHPSETTVHYASLADLRKAVHFTVPDPGPVLNGYRRVDFAITRGLPPLDPGPTVEIGYSSDLGTAGVEVSGAGSAEAKRIAGALKGDVGPRLRGLHFVADTGDDSYQFRCGDSYVFVSMYVHTLARWRAILTQVARDCPAA